MSVPTDHTDEPLAIIGMACRLPGATNLEEYWRLVIEGRSSVREAPTARFNQDRYFDPQKGTRGKSYSKLACTLDNRDFDPSATPLAPELAATVDLTHLLMTNVAADALRHAGIDPFNVQPKNAAVFIGHAQGSGQLSQFSFRDYVEEAVELLAQTPDYQGLSPEVQQQARERLQRELLATLPVGDIDTRNMYCNMVAGTVAKAFDLTGPWLAMNSACASSLHAMLLGARALQLGRADMVIVGGASDFKDESLVLFSAAQTLSTDGSRPFDAEADGLVMSEGYVALVMKTLRRALADGDPIQAVVRGLGLASDGRGKSLWAPRKEGQMKAMQRAYRSGVDMAGLQYLEAHATSTQVGDATELETLGEVLGPKFPPGKKIPVTSVKANIGHTLECAGISGVIKTVLCMQRQTYPAAINIRSLNNKIDWQKAPYFIPQQNAHWDAPAPGQPRRAAVNAFGIGGLNMHVVLDEFTESAKQLVATPPARPDAAPLDRAIAVVGMGCVFPGGLGLSKYWETLQSGHDPKVAPPETRWSEKALAELAARGEQVRGGFVTDFAYDWRRHKVPPKQVAEADPLQFMLLEAAEQALNDAGYDRKALDREKCGVVVGTEFGGDFSDHLEIGLRLPEMHEAITRILADGQVGAAQIDTICKKFSAALLKKWPSLVDETGSFTTSTLASRITKTLDLAGGAVALDSGSTSSLAGLSIAIDMLLSGDNDVMICAAGQRRMGAGAFKAYRTAGLGATDAAHNVLDAAYDGVTPAEGVGVVVLKRLADAKRDGDRIHAVIRGLGVAHASTSAAAIRLAAERASAQAGISPTDVTLAEIDTEEQLSPGQDELQALLAIHAGADRQHPLIMGSATAQFGHMGGAAGMSALIKVGLEIDHAQATPVLGLQTPSQTLAQASTAVQLPRAAMKWTGPRVAALVSWSKGQAFHLILEPAAPIATAAPAANAAPVATAQPAAATPPAVKISTVAPVICRYGAASLPALLARLDEAAGNANVAWQVAAKSVFQPADTFRVAIVADSAESLARKLQLRSQLQNTGARQVLEQQGVFFRQTTSQRPRVAFIFPGQGSQYEGMLRTLVVQSPAAASKLREIDATMARLGFPTFAELAWNTPTKLGADVWTTQVAMLLADALVLAALAERNIQPDLVLGHSYGEFPALYAAGVWDFETAVRMTRARCEGISAVAVGDSGMLATDAAADVAEAIMKTVPGHSYLANLNAPDQTVIGAKRLVLDKLAIALQAKSLQARILSVPAAFHTPLMAGASRLLADQVQSATLQAPRVPFVSTVTNSEIADPAQIRRNLAAQLTTPVRYAELIARLAAERPTVFVEVGPQQTFTKLNRRILDAEASVIACDNPKRPGLEPLAYVQALLECLGAYGVAAPATAVSVTTSHSEPNRKPMSDEIPHFDATEVRRAKMRDGSAGKSPARPAAPAPIAKAAPRIAAAPASTPPTKQSPAPAARPAVSAAPTTPPVASKPQPAPQVAISLVAPKPAVAPQPVVAPSPQPPVATPAQQTIAPQSAAPKATASAITVAASEDLAKFLVNFVVEQTGYPPEVVDLDADLEADLGIDSIKKAQLFGELQEYFDIGATATNLSLDDFPTLRHVLNFLAQSSAPAPATAATQTASPPQIAIEPTAIVAPVAVPVAPVAAEAPAPAIGAVSTANPAELESFLINFVVEQTGYPAEVVELDADLEADLGIDSIKKAQLFGELQEYFDIGATATNLSLDDFPTLRHVLNFLAAQSSPGATESPVESVAPAATPSAAAAVPTPAPVPDPIAPPVSGEIAPATVGGVSTTDPAELESFLINFVVEQTGYPAEVVELDADLEADLGIDSIKKAQLFGELQEYFDIGASATNLSLDDFPTLRHVLNFLAAQPAPASPTNETPTAAPAASLPPTAATPVLEVVTTPKVVVSGTEPIPSAPSNTTPLNTAAPIAANAAELESFLINFVVEQTGYPAEVVELDADLEADLGIDSIKKAQLFGELQEYFDIGATATNLSLDDFPTLRHVLNFLAQHGSAGVPTADLANGSSHANGHVAVGHAANGHATNGHSTNGHGANGYGSNGHESNGHSGNGHTGNGHGSNLHLAPVAAANGGALHTLRGVPYDNGFQIGRSHAQQIVQLLRSGVDSGSESDALASSQTATAQLARLSSNELDQLQGIADAVEVPLASLLAHHETLIAGLNGALQCAASTPAFGSNGSSSAAHANGYAASRSADFTEPAPPELPNPSVTIRYGLEMRETPRTSGAARMTWGGAAIVLGDDDVAKALRNRLEQDGVVVHELAIDDDLDQILAELAQICQQGPAPHLFITTANDALSGDWWNEERWNTRRRQTMLTPFFVCQKWVQLATAGGWLDRATVVATTQLGGDFGFSQGPEGAAGGALAGLLKAIFIEYAVLQGLKDLRVKAIDAAIDTDPIELAEDIVAELGSGALDVEVAFVEGRRFTTTASEQPLGEPSGSNIRRGGVWAVTGGARGITAACALELGRRHGLKLHLLGASPAPNIDPAWRSLDAAGLEKLKASLIIAARKAGLPAGQSWERARKDLEIDRSLRAFAEAGVEATYHTCDVSNRRQLADLLEQIRKTSGPIEGILHGAGIDRSCRFDKKQREVVDQTIGAKVDGAAHLMALTRRDPIRHFLGFGSISGRIGSFGQADYCLSNDMLCKLIGAYRRERPWIRAVGFHWHPWDEVGMAARPETKNSLQSKVEMTLMPLTEGIAHFIGEIAAGCPTPEVMITERSHWRKFSALTDSASVAAPEPAAVIKTTPVAKTPAVAKTLPAVAPVVQPAPEPVIESVELLTERCLMQALSAPLSTAPQSLSLGSPVWILGDNSVAQALRARLEAAGVAAPIISSAGDADHTLAELDRMWAQAPAQTLFLMTGRDAAPATLLDAAASTARCERGMLLPFLVTQRWHKLLASRPDLGRATLVAAVSLGGEFGFRGVAPAPEGGAITGLLKSVAIEDARRDEPRLRVKVIDAPADEPAAAVVDSILLELAGDEPEVEVCWTRGERRVIRPLPNKLSTTRKPIPRGGVWVVTGGARGITSVTALELARRYGWKLHLIGKSPAPQPGAPWRGLKDAELKSYVSQVARQAIAAGASPAAATDSVNKDVEIFNNLQQFADAGVSATYHSCDISDRAALATVLHAVRRQDGPIAGVIHGAGTINPAKFENKRREQVAALFDAKVIGALNLMALTADDPLTYFVGFGSISGRFGSNGQTDYAAGNDALAKLIDWFRSARPSCPSTCVHWESWEGSGMATQPRYAFGPKSIQMKYMQPDEGVRRLEQELEAGLPDSEVLYTFGEYYPMVCPREQYALGPFTPGVATSRSTAAWPLLQNVRTTAEGATADARLDPLADPFLTQHRLRGKPLLPVVVGMEIFAEVARAASGQSVVALDNVQMLDGLLFHAGRPVTAQTQAVRQPTGVYACVLTNDFLNRSGGLIQKARPYLKAEVRVGDGSVPVPVVETFASAPAVFTDVSYPEDAAIWHGAPFRCLTGVQCDRDGGWGRLVSLPLADLTGREPTADWTVPSCVLDAALFACGVHLYLHGHGAVSLPKAIDHLQFGRAARDGEQCLVHFACRELTVDSACYDFTLMGDDGQLIAAAQGYRKVILTRGATQ